MPWSVEITQTSRTLQICAKATKPQANQARRAGNRLESRRKVDVSAASKLVHEENWLEVCDPEGVLGDGWEGKKTVTDVAAVAKCQLNEGLFTEAWDER